MATFALALIDGLSASGDALVRVRALVRNGRNEFDTFCRKAQTAGRGTDLQILLRYLDDLAEGKPLPASKFKPLRAGSGGAKAHPGKYELKQGRPRAYCVRAGDELVVVFSGHAKKGRGGRRNTDQDDMIAAFRQRIGEIDGPLADLPELD